MKVSIRPEEFVLTTEETPDALPATIDSSIFLGLNTHYFLHTDKNEPVEVIQESLIDSTIPDGTRVWLKVKREKINLFTTDSEVNIVQGVVNDNA